MHGRNKVVIARAIEAYLIGECETVFRELYAADCVAAGPDIEASSEAIPIPLDCVASRDHSLMYKTAFPDMAFKVDELIEEGDSVAARWTVRGGDCGNDAARKLRQRLGLQVGELSTTGVVFCRLLNEKIVEIWQFSDMITLIKHRGNRQLEEGIVV